jgi:molybdopterin-guanine dinucleotide biosynthesis protein A
MDDPVGVVLAGGRSSRMGRDKATLTVGGRTLAGRAADLLGSVCAEVLVADRGRSVVPGVPSIADGPGRGPAAGLLGAARHAPGRPLLALACDLPRVPAPLLAALVELARRSCADLALPRSPRGPEPLAAVYGPRALAALAERVAAGEHALMGLLDRDDLAVAVLEGDALTPFGDPAEVFRNVNTPADLRGL